MNNKKGISSLFDHSGNLTPDALQRYINLQLGPEELKAVEAHLENSPFDREAMEGLQKQPSADLQQVLAGLDDRISRVAKEKTGTPVLPMKRRINLAVAAGLLALIALTVMLVFMFRSPVNEQLAVTSPSTPVETKQPIVEPPTSTIDNRQPTIDNQPVGGVAIKEEKKMSSNKDIEQPKSTTQNVEPGTWNLELESQNPEPETRNPEPEIQNPEPETPNPEPVTLIAVQDEEMPDQVSAIDVKAHEMQDVMLEEVQESPYSKSSRYESEAFLVVEQMPEFPGGEDSLYRFIMNNLHYPENAKNANIQGTVYVRFIVGRKGKISEIALLRGIGGGCDEEAMRVIREMPDWIPGKQNGKDVPVYFTLPVKFSLQ
jgi:protein TonB